MEQHPTQEVTVRSDDENAMQQQYAGIAWYESLVCVMLLLSLPECFSTTETEWDTGKSIAWL